MFKKVKLMVTQKNFMLIDGIGFLFIGLIQSINSFIGYSCNSGLYKILSEIKFAALGVFESSVLIFIIGLILVKTVKNSENVVFWNLISFLTHLMIGMSNIIFWDHTFVVNNAESSGAISIIIHFSFSIIQFFLIFSKVKINK